MIMEKFCFDIVSRTLTLTANYRAAMANPESDEYKMVVRLQTDFPNLKIIQKTHATPRSYITKSGEKYKHNQFKDLTYERMERFIAAIPQNEAYMAEYRAVKAFACEAKRNGYPLVRNWFIEQFPKFRKDPLFYFQTPPLPVHSEPFLERHKQARDIFADDIDIPA